MFPIESERSKADVRLANEERVTKVCKYKKGNWTSCDKTVMLVKRVDQLRKEKSSEVCELTRTVTKSCKDKEEEREVSCVYQKPRTATWTECKVSGIHEKVLHLIREKV